MRSFKVTLEEEEIEAVERFIKESQIDTLLSSLDHAVVFGVLHQILEQYKDEEF